MRRGWFKIPGLQNGDRELAVQMAGLGPALEACAGKTVLDLGCAEGLIAREFAKRGAAQIWGIEIIREHVQVGIELCAGMPIEFIIADIADFVWPLPAQRIDMVLMLAVLHKTREPAKVLERFADLAGEELIIRLPGGARNGAYSLYERRGNEFVDVAKIMSARGFVLARTERGPNTRERGPEPVLYFRRREG